MWKTCGKSCKKIKKLLDNIEFLYDEGIIDEEFDVINDRLKDFFESINVEGDE